MYCHWTIWFVATRELSPDELLGMTYLRDMEDGQQMNAWVSKKISNEDAQNHQDIKFMIEVGEGAFDEILANDELSDLSEKMIQEEQEDTSAGWHSRWLPDIKVWSHQAIMMIKAHHTTSEKTIQKCMTLVEMIKNDPVSCIWCAKENDLLEMPVLKSLKWITKCEKEFMRMMMQVKMHSQRNVIT
jgi:hypothetical protein